MPSLKEIKGRIASVNSTRKITSAMKMVASSKLHHAQVAIQNMLPYETMLEHILKSFLAAEAEPQTIFDQERPVKRVALVVFSSNSSLCGGFNANVIKLMQRTVDAYTEELGPGSVEVWPIGRKVTEKAKKLGYDVKCDKAPIVDHPNVNECIEIAMELGQEFADGKIATKKAQDYLKKNRRKKEVKEGEVAPLNDNFIVEPDMNTVLTQLLPKFAHLMLYTALLDSIASEHAARMVAMQTATDNADELLRQLNLQYNKSRQQSITTELLDIVGGSVDK